ncbi:GNAT family N-acetyltransferase [Methylobacterium sp. J-068]|uniref:GNAT family N-acetyltransferase n=1 Tax=Methylobacterium sp. J-068 TaxID=2836649 RepID=UPI001FBA06D2|nr:GNAT family N-acetyltransferase [Methylobacterium sp. J-068]MCJ2033487.1 GNAT family N-acetyltransferase [Methylobacterium sp. J-068]
MSVSIAVPGTASNARPDARPERSDASERRALGCAEYIAADGSLRIRAADVASYADPAPGGLYTHPVWLRTYGIRDLLVVEGLTSEPAVPRLVFARDGGGLVHQGRLFRLDAGLIAALGDRLLKRDGVHFVVFEDVDVPGPIASGFGRFVFHYQNNWRLPLREAAERMSKQLVTNTKRKARGLARENPGLSVRFEAAPSRAVLDTIAAFGRIRIEGQGRRYGIDDREVERLATVSAEIGHATIVRTDDAILAADLICIAGDQAHFLTHGYDPGYPKSSLGMISLINSIETCAARGVSDFNLMWGDLPYKQQLGAERVALRTIVIRRSPLTLLHPGHLAALSHFAWADLKRRLKPAVAALRGWKARIRPATG